MRRGGLIFARRLRRAASCTTDGYRGYDDDKAVRATRKKSRRIRFGGIVTVDRADLLEAQPLTDHGILVANPPYGERLGELDKLAFSTRNSVRH